MIPWNPNDVPIISHDLSTFSQDFPEKNNSRNASSAAPAMQVAMEEVTWKMREELNGFYQENGALMGRKLWVNGSQPLEVGGVEEFIN